MDEKRYFIITTRTAAIITVTVLLALFLAACGGSAPAEPAAPGTGGQQSAETAAGASAAPAVEEASEPEPEEAEEAEEPAADAPADEEAAEAPAADDASLLSGRPTSGTDPDTGLEINPDQIVPGVEFIVRGTVISFNLTPQDSPEFLIEAPSGTRYRVSSQPVPEIAYEDGTVLKPFEYQRGIFAQATVMQEANSGVTSVVISDDLMLLSAE